MSKDLLSRFQDGSGRIVVWPRKQSHKLVVLEYLVQKFETGRSYSEKEVNAVLNTWHTFEDWAVLRRALVDHKFMTRNRDGSDYRRIR